MNFAAVPEDEIQKLKRINEATDRPIIFNAPMVRAILEGRKTQTRRVVKPPSNYAWHSVDDSWSPIEKIGEDIRCPYGKSGDRLWVRETFRYDAHAWTSECGGEEESLHIIYHADGEKREPNDYPSDFTVPDRDGNVPCIHMPRWASRINLEITNVRVERLNEITKEDCLAEGIKKCPTGAVGCTCELNSFQILWESVSTVETQWAANPWVWVIEFKVVKNA